MKVEKFEVGKYYQLQRGDGLVYIPLTVVRVDRLHSQDDDKVVITEVVLSNTITQLKLTWEFIDRKSDNKYVYVRTAKHVFDEAATKAFNKIKERL